jgi:Uma2 family endonuclease
VLELDGRDVAFYGWITCEAARTTEVERDEGIMATVILDRGLADRLREERAAAGADRWDEVWEGTYMMAPLPNIEHQQIANRLGAICLEVVGWTSESIVLTGTNVSDRVHGWEHNFRCPDVAVYFPMTSARNCNTHWKGGPDFASEITSEDDRTRDKVDFYANVDTRELLIIDRDPWQMELLRLTRKKLKSVGVVSPKTQQSLASRELPLRFRFLGSKARPIIRVEHTSDERQWDV